MDADLFNFANRAHAQLSTATALAKANWRCAVAEMQRRGWHLKEPFARPPAITVTLYPKDSQ